MIFWVILSLSSNFYLSYWTTKSHEGEGDDFYYLKIYAVLSLAYAFFNVIRSASALFKSVECSENIHYSMMKSIIRAPINLFFDRVPIGRILNRFSKDLNVVDQAVVQSLIRVITTLCQLVTDIVICVYGGTFYVLPLVGIFFYLSYKSQQSYQKLNREVVRLGNKKLFTMANKSSDLLYLINWREHIKKPDFESVQWDNKRFDFDSRVSYWRSIFQDHRPSTRWEHEECIAVKCSFELVLLEMFVAISDIDYPDYWAKCKIIASLLRLD